MGKEFNNLTDEEMCDLMCGTPENYESWNIKGYELEYFDDEHLYLVDGVIVPSITQLLKKKFNKKYDNVNAAVLKSAAEKGTAVHQAIEDYCKHGIESDIRELRNFKFLQRQYDFSVLDNEVPIILIIDDKPIAAGRLDMVMEINGELGLADIKRTSTLDKEYLGYQLNLYRLAYQSCYDAKITFLKGLHLREEKRKMVDIPINEEYIREFIRNEVMIDE